MYFASCNNIDEDLRVKPEDDILENFEDDFLNELVEFCVSAGSCAERMRWRPRVKGGQPKNCLRNFLNGFQLNTGRQRPYTRSGRDPGLTVREQRNGATPWDFFA